MCGNMTMIASCGHEIYEFNDETTINIKEYAPDYDLDRVVNVVCTMTVCRDCLKSYRKNNLILDTQEQIDKWMKGESK